VTAAVAFDDTVGGVSGMWVGDRAPATVPGLTVSVMIADATAVVAEILTAGGGIVRPVDTEAQEKFAWFRDPAGNLLGIYQQPGPRRYRTRPRGLATSSTALPRGIV
jgi:predicted enzyme related to lactoylglutathione lyase